ncbi:hypothetical protein GYB29_16295 [bacterium]|nr:hypothetical protein [bacterium]
MLVIVSIAIIVTLLLLARLYLHVTGTYIPKLKGRYGEYKVASVLNRLNKKDYYVFHDVLLKYGKSTTQIDHIVICKAGIFVIETKNYKGWIHGSENSRYWSQTLYDHKSTFTNPIRQNWVHVNAVKSTLVDINDIPFFPIIVFAGSATLKNVYSNVPVIYKSQLLNKIKELNQSESFSKTEIEKMVSIINRKRLTSAADVRRHLKQVKKKSREQVKKKPKFCPRCGSHLELRHGKYGEFYGCFEFPKCKYTQKVETLPNK